MQVSDDTIVSNLKYRSIRISIDSDYRVGFPHAGNVLHSPGNATGDI